MVVSPDIDDDIQIADFGLSKFAAPEEVMKLPCGTLAYVAPEVLQMQGYSKEVDLWSIGVILFVLLRGKLPFDGKKKAQIISKTVSGKIPFEGDAIWEKVSPLAKDLITHLLQVDPAKRYTVPEALAHPWFSEILPKPERRKSKAKPRRSLPAQAAPDSELKIQTVEDMLDPFGATSGSEYVGNVSHDEKSPSNRSMAANGASSQIPDPL
jgi:serine/threonine protein kinase